MDTKHIDIPIVEDDMGEGFRDPIEAEEDLMDKQQRELWKLEEKLRRHRKI